jgi:hypothetical protein
LAWYALKDSWIHRRQIQKALEFSMLDLIVMVFPR